MRLIDLDSDSDYLLDGRYAIHGRDSVPSAQPETHEKRTETHACDCISRQAAIDAIEEYSDRLQMVNWKENPGVPYKVHTLNWCVNTIRELPSAQPEIIRCKDCKHGRPYKHTTAYVECKVDGDPIDRDSDFFCRYGERRE